MEQITEYIRVQVKPETTEMELQLHPASLGNIKVQVASREGVLTASFTTQNEAVKAALESQMVQLKESFEQQGIKVEAIEVNVEARGFERSLDQQNQEQSRDQFTEGSRRGTRRIRLGGGSEEELDDEDLTEEDRIVADMMIRNGNTVDYTA
jgi:flagellar hook-length control protein FliK